MNNQVRKQNTDVFVVTTLQQARLLADEFKLKLLRAFATTPTTVKQVAADIEEKPTRLYRHIDALLEAGLLRVVRERPKRGTVERTLQTVASRFEADPSLFDDVRQPGGQDAIRYQFQAASDALVAALSQPETADEDLAPICARMLIEATPERLQELHGLLLEWMHQAAAEPHGDVYTESASAMLVYHRNAID